MGKATPEDEVCEGGGGPGGCLYARQTAVLPPRVGSRPYWAGTMPVAEVACLQCGCWPASVVVIWAGPWIWAIASLGEAPLAARGASATCCACM